MIMIIDNRANYEQQLTNEECCIEEEDDDTESEEDDAKSETGQNFHTFCHPHLCRKEKPLLLTFHASIGARNEFISHG